MRKIILILMIAAFLSSCVSLEDGGSSADSHASQDTATSKEESKVESQEQSDNSSEQQSEDVCDSSDLSDADSSEEAISESTEESEPEVIIDLSYVIDIEPYWDYICSESLLLVNKENTIDDEFEPEDLVDITYTRSDRPKEKMNRTAEMALQAFLGEAYALGYDDVTVTSGYRSYAKQSSLYNYYISQEMDSGKSREEAVAAVNKYSAIPGTSEHHTGLCVDMHNLSSAQQKFGNTEAGKWLAANAHRFGFILRYPADKVEITGYMYEPWHFRFVGLEHATAIYESGMSLEEYMATQQEIDEEIGN